MKVMIASINPPIPPPIISIPAVPGDSKTIEYANKAPIATSASRASVLFTVPSRVILSVAIPPWKCRGFSAGLLLLYTM